MFQFSVIIHTPNKASEKDIAVFKANLTSLTHLNPKNIICVCPSESPYLNISNLPCSFFITNATWAKGINTAVKQTIDTPWILFIDPNIRLQTNLLKDILPRTPPYIQYIIPYSTIFIVPEDQITDNSLQFNFCSNIVNGINKAIEKSYPLFITKQAFLSLNGYPTTYPKNIAEILFNKQIRKQLNGKTLFNINVTNYEAAFVKENEYIWNIAKIKHSDIQTPHINIQRSLNTKRSVLEDTALIIAYYYENEQRHIAVKKALQQLKHLNPAPVLFFVDLILPGDTEHQDIINTITPVFGKNAYIPIQGAERHRYVFHKEDLYNKTVNEFLPENIQYLIFLDADSHPLKYDWINRTRNKLQEVKETAVIQPWSFFKDTKDSNFKYTSFAKLFKKLFIKQYSATGLSIAMTSTLFKELQGFPMCCPAGGGDSLFMFELTKISSISKFENYEYIKQKIRQLPAKQIDYIEEFMFHVYHGNLSNRCYVNRHKLIQKFWPFENTLFIDDQGLLSVTPGSPLQYCLAHRRELKTEADIERIYKNSLKQKNSLFIPRFITQQKMLNQESKDSYWKHRWGYTSVAIKFVKDLNIYKQSLEIGANGLSIIENSFVMDCDPNRHPDIVHDATVEPWPFEDKQFSVVIALQVVEHLSNKQAFFKQAARISDYVVISIPWEWPSKFGDHGGISWPSLYEWTANTKPERFEKNTSRMVLLYNSDALSNNIRTVFLT